MDNSSHGSDRLDLRVWAKLWPFLAPMRWRFVFVLAMMVFSAAVDALIPLFTSYAVNNFVIPQSVKGLLTFAFLYLIVIVAQSATTVLYSRQCMIIEMQTGRKMKHDCFMHLQTLPLSFFSRTPVGYILARVMSDTNRICGLIAWGSIHFFWNLFYIIGAVIAMFCLNWRMAIAVVCVIPLIVAASLYFQPRLIRANRDIRTANSRITGSYNENITGAKTSKTLSIEDQITDEFGNITADMYRASMRSVRLEAMYVPLITFLSSTAAAFVLYRGGLLTIENALDFGVFSAFVSYSIAILEPLRQMSSMLSNLTAAQVNIERVDALLNEKCTIADTPEVIERFGSVFDPRSDNFPPLHGDIELDHVWFRYDDAHDDDWVLEDISIKIPAGTTVAIVGETGAGKSTLVNLICRFFEPVRGRILIDGVDYRERSQSWLHSNLGYVQQTPHLFSGTLRENIRYGCPGASDEKIMKAAALVSADTVAGHLEHGWDTEVGEGGDTLSTGEKQLVSFARAVIADPPLFVLDEATSSIDTETERLIQDAIDKVLVGRTSFIIAHRLSTIRNADLILFVDDHGIAERGSHSELMAAKGKYYNLYTAMMLKTESEQIGFGI